MLFDYRRTLPALGPDEEFPRGETMSLPMPDQRPATLQLPLSNTPFKVQNKEVSGLGLFIFSFLWPFSMCSEPQQAKKLARFRGDGRKGFHGSSAILNRAVPFSAGTEGHPEMDYCILRLEPQSRVSSLAKDSFGTGGVRPGV
jgi:hypothetical protein